MSYSQNLTLGEIAYDGFHAIDEEETFTPFGRLPEELQVRWAQAARNACDAWTKPGGVDQEAMKANTREAHKELRERATMKRAKLLLEPPDNKEPSAQMWLLVRHSAEDIKALMPWLDPRSTHLLSNVTMTALLQLRAMIDRTIFTPIEAVLSANIDGLRKGNEKGLVDTLEMIRHLIQLGRG